MNEQSVTIWCDACPNTVTRAVGAWGKHLKFDNCGYRVAIKCGEAEAWWTNSRCTDQFAAECFAVLRAVDWAREAGHPKITVRNDRVASFYAYNRKAAGYSYLAVARRIAEEHGIDVTFEPCSSDENLADEVVRRPGKAR